MLRLPSTCDLEDALHALSNKPCMKSRASAMGITLESHTFGMLSNNLGFF